MPFINIITAVSRPENLQLLKDSIEKEILPYFHTRWYCIYDPASNLDIVQFTSPWIISMKGGIPNDISGASQRNIALDNIETGWNFCLDDDNLIYPDFGKIMAQRISDNTNVQAFIFNQPRGTGDLIAAAENIKLGSIDVAQILFDRKLIGKKRFFANVYVSDYYFIKRIYKRNEDKFMFLNENLCYYNFLRK